MKLGHWHFGFYRYRQPTQEELDREREEAGDDWYEEEAQAQWAEIRHLEDRNRELEAELEFGP